MTGGPLALIIADDLSGAADSAVAFGRRGVPTQVTFDATSSPAGVEVIAVIPTPGAPTRPPPRTW